ncbi:MAG: ATP-binding protein [Gemmatimonadota bacterium]
MTRRRLSPHGFRTTFVVAGVLALLATPRASLAQRTAATAAIASTDAVSWVRESWTARDGLPVNSINALIQTRDGYIWAATFDGLVRYDGVRFTVFNTASTPGLPSNRFIDVQEMQDGSLLLRTERFDLVRFTGERATTLTTSDGVPLLAHRIVQDRFGTVWVGTDRGLGRVSGSRVVPVARESIDTLVLSLAAPPKGDLHVSDVTGRVWRVGADGRATAIPYIGGTRAFAVEDAAMYFEASGNVVLGALGTLWRGRDSLRRVPSAPIDPAYRYGILLIAIRRSPASGKLWLYGTRGVYRETPSGFERVATQYRVYPYPALFSDAAGLWYAVENRVYLDGRLMHTLEQTGKSLDPIEVTSMLVDREGSVWLGTQSAGLYRLTKSLFRSYGVPEGGASNNIYPILETADSSVWLGTWGKGITRVEPSRGRVTSLGEDVGAPPFVQSFLADGGNRLLVAAGYGVVPCVTAPVFRCEAEIADIGRATVSALFRDGDGVAWAGSSDGLFRRDAGRWARVPGAPVSPVRAAERTKDGAMWMATNGGGLARWADGRFITITTAEGLPTNVIRSLHADADGWLWVGTEGRGLVRIDPREWTTPLRAGETRHIVRIGTEHGLYDEVVHQILDDGAGQFWMSSNRGIFRVARNDLLAFADGRAKRISSVSYTERDGLRNREANGGFFPAGIRAHDGRLWFPTQAGAVVVDPRRVERTTVAPPIVVERLITRERALPAGRDTIALQTGERDLEIQYTAPSFIEPGSLRFRYRLVPYDADWVDADQRRTAFYTRVPPGRYRFEVMVADGRGGWPANAATLDFTVTPRWDETLPIRLLAGLAVILAIVLAARWRVQLLRRRAVALEALVDARTVELRDNQQELASRNSQLAEQASALAELSGARSRMFANLSHEFRTPLTLILGPLQGMLEGRYGALPDALREQHSLMQRNARRLLRLINQILDLARLQSGAMTIERREQDLVPFTQGVVRAFAELAQRRAVTLDVQAAAPSITFAFDASQIEKVLLNLLSNALKFTPGGGRVDVTLAREAGDAVIVVRDTGVGISAAELPHVFERFYQVDGSSTRRYEGTGIGLALARELVELHGGTISAESAPSLGSVFTVRLPMEVAATVSSAAPVAQVTARVASTPVSDEPVLSPWQTLSDEHVGFVSPQESVVPQTDLSEDRTTVLVVDDNHNVREYVQSVLRTRYRVLQAEDGRTGLEVAQRDLPDLIVADVMMPGMDGLALGRALRDDPMTDAIPLVLLTARAESEAQVAGYAAGADAYLTKPFAPAVLEACVAGLLSQRRRLRLRYQAESVPDVPEIAIADALVDTIDDSVALPEPELAIAPEGPTTADVAVVASESVIGQRLRPLVLARLTDESLTPATLAEAAGLSYHQMYRALNSEAGSTPSRFIRGVRAERAAEMLRGGEGSVSEIAYAVGFESLSYFSRAFRERFGVSPVTYLRGRAAVVDR